MCLLVGYSLVNVVIEKDVVMSVVRIFSCMVLFFRGLVGSLIVFDWQDVVCDRSGFVRVEEGGERCYFFYGDEFFGWLCGEQYVVYDLFICNVVCFGGVWNLFFDEWCEYVVWVQCVDGDVLFCDFECYGFGEVGDVVFRGDIG